MKMKRASYREAVRWIAEIDEPTEQRVDVIDGAVTVLLIADLFRVDARRVALDVLHIRMNPTEGVD
jgi:hypothetical protein